MRNMCGERHYSGETMDGVCVLHRGHLGEHHAYDASVDISWPQDESEQPR